MDNKKILELENEIDLFNKLGFEHPNEKYIKSKEFTNVLVEMIKDNLNNLNGGNNYGC